MKKYSKSLHDWGRVLNILGILFFIVGIFYGAFEDNFSLFAVGGWMIVLSPVVHGFATVVQNAEEQIEERHDMI